MDTVLRRHSEPARTIHELFGRSLDRSSGHGVSARLPTDRQEDAYRKALIDDD